MKLIMLHNKWNSLRSTRPNESVLNFIPQPSYIYCRAIIPMIISKKNHKLHFNTKTNNYKPLKASV